MVVAAPRRLSELDDDDAGAFHERHHPWGSSFFTDVKVNIALSMEAEGIVTGTGDPDVMRWEMLGDKGRP
jgi:hypothetical protein